MPHFGEDTPGVQRIHGEQDTEPATRQALEEQKHGDEFNPKPVPDVEMLAARLTELEEEQIGISHKLYGNFLKSGGDFKRPPWLEREKLDMQMAKIDEEISSIKGQLRQHLIAMGFGDPGSPFGGLGF